MQKTLNLRINYGKAQLCLIVTRPLETATETDSGYNNLQTSGQNSQSNTILQVVFFGIFPKCNFGMNDILIHTKLSK